MLPANNFPNDFLTQVLVSGDISYKTCDKPPHIHPKFYPKPKTPDAIE